MAVRVLGNTNYNWAFPYIEKPITSAVEIGSRDGLDAVTLASTFSCPLTAFECDPAQHLVTLNNVNLSGVDGINVLPYALSNADGLIEFWQVDTSVYNNPGTGSLFLVNFDNRMHDDPDLGRPSIQKSVMVSGARFDSLGIEAPELIAMDVQGAEIAVLEGFGSLLRQCKYIITEAERVPSYVGGNSFRELDRFIRRQGFELKATSIGSGSKLSRWRQYISSNMKILIRDKTLFPMRRYQGCFDVLYVNKNRTM